jgi:hypothetical protein
MVDLQQRFKAQVMLSREILSLKLQQAYWQKENFSWMQHLVRDQFLMHRPHRCSNNSAVPDQIGQNT